MIRWLIGSLCGAVLCGFLLPERLVAQTPEDKSQQEFNAQTQALADRIDKIIEARLAKEKIKPGPLASDAVFVRRIHIDLAGRVPDLLKATDFLDDEDVNKRAKRIDELLASEDYANNFANYWRALMVTENANNFQAQALRPSFEAWLRQKLQSNTAYDKMVHELLTVNPQFNGGGGMNNITPAAFYFGNENKAENLAGATSRIFLGVKIECAQCHPHPFAKWKQTQFWEYAAFFGGMQQFNGGRGNQQVNQFLREIKIPETDKVIKAKFLDGTDPKWKDGTPTRTTLADWVTAPENPYFSKAAVDHVWSYFFGVSLLEPITEPNDDSPPAHPELLDEMAREFTAQGFNLKFLIRSIVLTKAYQRVSVAMSEKNKEKVQLFANMPVRGMTPEQFFDSIAVVTEYKDANVPQFNQQQFGQTTPRREFLAKFTTQDKRSETQTSILQALLMMNGKFLTERIKELQRPGEPEINKPAGALHTIADKATTPTERAIETLYRLVLSRMPRPEETTRLAKYIDSNGPTGDRLDAVSDVFWALLNSGEFMLNH